MPCARIDVRIQVRRDEADVQRILPRLARTFHREREAAHARGAGLAGRRDRSRQRTTRRSEILDDEYVPTAQQAEVPVEGTVGDEVAFAAPVSESPQRVRDANRFTRREDHVAIAVLGEDMWQGHNLSTHLGRELPEEALVGPRRGATLRRRDAHERRDHRVVRRHHVDDRGSVRAMTSMIDTPRV